MKKILIRLVMLLVLALAPLMAQGQPTQSPPGQVSYQGFLTDANGVPLATNAPRNYTVQFRIWNASSGGAVKWEEQQTVTVDRGYFTVMLGSGAAINGTDPLFTNNLTSVFSGSDASDRYLGIQAQITGPADPEILPRLRLLASPYALLAGSAVNVVGSNVISGINLASNSVDGSKILDGSIANVEIAANAAIADSKLATIATAGKVADTALSANVALRAGGNSFTGNQTIGNASGVTTLTVNGNINAAVPTGPGGSIGLTLLGWGDPNTGFNGGSFGVAASAGAWSTDATGGYGFGDCVLRANTGKLLLQSGSGASAICITAANRVGIGTTTPGVPLDVSGSVCLGTSSISSYFNTGSTALSTIGAYSCTFATSIRANGCVMGGQIAAYSDQRIKNVIGRSDSAEDLSKLLNLEVTDYLYKDVVAKGSRPQKKVIAQQVEKVFPQVVGQTTDVVPDIFKKAALKGGWVELTTDLKVGERVRLIMESDSKTNPQSTYEVVEVKEGKFRTDSSAQEGEVFVYGREVKDFRVVDYEGIAMLNVSATQELAKRLEQKSAEVVKLEQDMADLKKQVAQLVADSKGSSPSGQKAQAHAAVSKKTVITASLEN